MKKLPFYVVLLSSLFFSIASAGVELPVWAMKPLHGIEKSVSLATAKVWVIKENQQLQHQSDVWMVKDTKQAQQKHLSVGVKDPKSKLTDFQLAKETKQPTLKPYHEMVKNTSIVKGLFPLYRNKETGKIFLELKPEQLNKNYLSTMTMESGIGERGIYSGMPLQD